MTQRRAIRRRFIQLNEARIIALGARARKYSHELTPIFMQEAFCRKLPHAVIKSLPEGAFMPATQINDIEQLRGLIGQEVGISDWLNVTQERIQQFADATSDHQWIHLDAERAKTESPYGTTIAHGFLTLSLMVPLMESAVQLKMPTKMGINYGLNRVRFVSAVPAGSNIRARVTIHQVEEIPGGHQITWQVTVEIENASKPALVAEWLTRRYS
jgi:acyl dehydratase